MDIDVLRSREKSGQFGTPGLLTVSEVGFQCDTLELRWKDNRRGVSCILPDTYDCWTWTSPTLNKKGSGLVLRLEDKHGRGDCLVHNGNFAGDPEEDPELITNVHGCTLTGRGYGQIGKPHGGTQWGIMRSVDTLNEFLAAVGPGHHRITYRWDEPE